MSIATSKALNVEVIAASCRCGAPTEVKRIGNLSTSGECEACSERAKRAQLEDVEERLLRGRVEQARNGMPGLLRRVGVDPDVHGHCRLRNFDSVPDSAALSKATYFCEDYVAGERPNMFLYSKRPGENVAPGNGKTHLLVGAVAELLERGAVGTSEVLFLRETQMTLELRRLCNGGRPEEFLAKLLRPQLLVLDDVGKAKTDNPWMRELIYELFAARESKSTAISSNYSLDELVDRDETFASVTSRILSKGYYTELNGPDRRPERRA